MNTKIRGCGTYLARLCVLAGLAFSAGCVGGVGEGASVDSLQGQGGQPSTVEVGTSGRRNQGHTDAAAVSPGVLPAIQTDALGPSPLFDASPGIGMDAGAPDVQLTPTGVCKRNTETCCDFENGFPSGWEKFEGAGATLSVDQSRPFAGKQSMHLTLPKTTGDPDAVAFMARSLPASLQKSHVYLRYRAYFSAFDKTNLRAWGHGSFVELEGMLTGGGRAQYAHGVQLSRFMGNFVQNQPFKELVSECQGAGDGCSAADADRAIIPTERWLCVELDFDGQSGKNTGVSIDGKALALNHYGTPGWPTMSRFDKIRFGLFQFWPNPAVQVWLDDVVIATAPVGCN